jgi:redox-sensitive bicupin YhaK (pirin superfamily)
MVFEQRRRDLGGGLAVGRVVPFAKRRMVGPFILFDHMGPMDLAVGIDRTHPHIALSTVTYLFAGEFMHRDSLGYEQPVRPREVNWMTAGSGITHSERFKRARANGDQVRSEAAKTAPPSQSSKLRSGWLS